ncbi:hypothetical protein LSAT2_008386 [Lamellibrachia satsuma]|nr:hypothetical protein LSAT2_008386 [Lamellibrachia satsuma]
MAYVTPVVRPNVVIAPADTPGVYSRYSSGQSTALGWIQVAVGVTVIIMSIISLATVENTVTVGDMFTGVLVISAGACGIGAGKYKTNPPIVGFMVLSIFASIVAIIAFFVWTVAIQNVHDDYHDTGYVGVATAMAYIFIFAYLIESIVSIWSAVICFNVACCGHRQATVAVATAGYNVQRGQVTVTVTQTSRCPSTCNPPPYPGPCYTQQPPPAYTASQQQQPSYGIQQGAYGMQQQPPYGMYGMQQ